MKANYGLLSFLALTLLQSSNIFAKPAGEAGGAQPEVYNQLDEIKQARSVQQQAEQQIKEKFKVATEESVQGAETATKTYQELKKLVSDIQFALKTAKDKHEDITRLRDEVNDKIADVKSRLSKADYMYDEIEAQKQRLERERVMEYEGHKSYLRSKLKGNKDMERESMESLAKIKSDKKEVSDLIAKQKKRAAIIEKA